MNGIGSLVPMLRQTLLRYGISVERPRFPDDHRIDVLDLLVEHHVKDKQKMVLVQIGANDGKSGDPVNCYIEKHRPRALLVEPMPEMFKLLTQNYTHVPSVTCENCAVAPADGQWKLFRVRSDPSLPPYVQQLASFDRNVILKQRRTVPRIADYIEEITVPALTFQSLVRKHSIDKIDLLQVDTEGFDAEIIKMVMQTPLRPTILNFETAHLKQADKVQCAQLLAREGYRYLTVGRDTIAHRPDIDR